MLFPMGFPPDSYELADLIEAEIGFLPITNEHTDAIIEMAMGRYPVRGDVEGEVSITNVDMAHVLAEDLRQVLGDEAPEAAMFAYVNGTATVRRLTEGLLARKLVDAGVFPGMTDVHVHSAGDLPDGLELALPSAGPRSDDLVLVDGGRVVGVAEVKASVGGFVYPLRASVKAVTQLRRTLEVNPDVMQAGLVLVDLLGHNVLVRWRDRGYWTGMAAAGVRRELRAEARAIDWPGKSPRLRHGRSPLREREDRYVSMDDG